MKRSSSLFARLSVFSISISIFIFISIFLFSSFIFSGCQISENNSSKISVVTSFYPLAFFAQEIAGEHANVINLSGGQSPHSYKISPQDRVKLSQADLIIYQGVGLETWSQDIIPELQQKGVHVLEASHKLHLNKREEHEHELELDEENEEEEHNHGTFDPHTWLDPVLAQQIAEQIAKNLIEIDSENTQIYKNNLEILTKKLQKLDTQFQSSLQNCVQKKAFISHDAFGYLEERYNFELFPIAGLSPSDEPSAKLIAKLQNIVETQHITHILTEENNVKKYAELLSEEAGIKMLSVHPLSTVPEGSDYFKTSYDNIISLSTAFQCQ